MFAKTTKQQRKAIHDKWKLSNDGHDTYRSFRKAVKPTFGMDGAVVFQWCNMWVAVEKDGYAHT
jgi:hypothetical protein